MLQSSTYQSHNDTIFVIKQGKKIYLYIPIYKYIHANVVGGGAVAPINAGEVEQHSDYYAIRPPLDHLEDGAEKDFRGV